MRLRRETGDFSIKLDDENTAITIVKGLSAEDFIGAVVEYNGHFYVVGATSEEDGVVTLNTPSIPLTITYTAETGKVEPVEEKPDH